MTWQSWAQSELDSLQALDRLRRLVPFDGLGPRGIVSGRSVISFAANDYLGLSHDAEVRAAAQAAIERHGTGSTSSRLLVGTRSLHAELEAEIAQWKRTECALVFPTGFAANLGVLSTLGTADTTIFSDALNHASIIDGCRLARANTVVYRHGDVDHLECLLRKASGRKLVVTDCVFSMEGDIAPLDELARLCLRYHALLVVDEAHFVLGSQVPSYEGPELLQIGTLSKALGASGGWVAGSRALIGLLVNRARSFIYTTGLSPADTAAALAAIRVYRSPKGEQLRQRLRELVDRVRPAHPSPIIPFILGEDRAALAAAKSLLMRGLYVPAIRPPTVPLGTARLRVALSAAHTDAMIDQLQCALAEISRETIGVCRGES
jgi:8-amino-7-oxononanoate synthase